MGVEFRDAATPGPGIKAPSKCPRTPPVALALADVSSGQHPSPTQCQEGPSATPLLPLPFPVGGEGPAGRSLHIPQAGAGWRPHMEEGSFLQPGRNSRDKNKAPNCLLKSWLGREPTQATGRTRSAQGGPGSGGGGGWAGSGPDPMGAVTSGAEVSASDVWRLAGVGCPVPYRASPATLPHSSHCCRQDPSWDNQKSLHMWPGAVPQGTPPAPVE